MSEMYNIAKEKDNGCFAHLGMREYCATWFGIDNVNAECVKYIVDTYLECIEDISFDTWIDGTSYLSRPIILKEKDLKSFFNDLWTYSNDLEIITDLFMYLYNQEFWIDKKNKTIFSTSYTLTDRIKFNYVGICMEYERLCTKHELEQLNWQDIESMVECLQQYGYDIENDYDYLENDVYETAYTIEDRLQQIFKL